MSSTGASRYAFVIPAYNDAEGLSRHLRFFSRRQEKIQLIIVDDCSDDETRQLLEASELPSNIRLCYRRLEVNSGPAIARNVGIGMIDADFVTMIDADDLLRDCFFDFIPLSPLASGADFVMFKYHLTHSLQTPCTYEMPAHDAAFFSYRMPTGPANNMVTVRERADALSTTNFPWNKTYRSDFLKQHIRFPDIRMHEDILPHWRSFLRADKFGILAWAPPLISHVEAPEGGRATNYVGPLRMAVFDQLEALHEEISHMEAPDPFFDQLSRFSEYLFDWLTGDALGLGNPDAEKWKICYAEAADAVREKFASADEGL